MQKAANRTERFHPAGYPPIDLENLDGQFCAICGDGFWSLRSEKQIACELSEHMAAVDSQRVVASELASVQEAAKALRVTSQGVHKMMRSGRLRYAIAGGIRLPLRKDIADISKRAAKR